MKIIKKKIYKNKTQIERLKQQHLKHIIHM